jgi:hypothetical protein
VRDNAMSKKKNFKIKCMKCGHMQILTTDPIPNYTMFEDIWTKKNIELKKELRLAKQKIKELKKSVRKLLTQY